VTVVEILEKLGVLGVTVTPIPPDRLRLEPASKVPPELVRHILQSKPEILAALAPPAVADQPAECRHCDGTGKCSCPGCTLRRTEKPVPCCMCRWQDRQVWLAATRPAACWFCEERRLHSDPGPCANCQAKAAGVQ
jgi:hypothetical protein